MSARSPGSLLRCCQRPQETAHRNNTTPQDDGRRKRSQRAVAPGAALPRSARNSTHPVDVADRKNEKPRHKDGEEIERDKQQDRLCLRMRRYSIARAAQCCSISREVRLPFHLRAIQGTHVCRITQAQTSIAGSGGQPFSWTNRRRHQRAINTSVLLPRQRGCCHTHRSQVKLVRFILTAVNPNMIFDGAKWPIAPFGCWIISPRMRTMDKVLIYEPSRFGPRGRSRSRDLLVAQFDTALCYGPSSRNTRSWLVSRPWRCHTSRAALEETCSLHMRGPCSTRNTP